MEQSEEPLTIEDPVKRKLVYLSITLDEISNRYRRSHLQDQLFFEHKLTYSEAVVYFYFLKAYYAPGGENHQVFKGITPIANAIVTLAKEDQTKRYQHGFIPTTPAKLFFLVRILVEKGIIVKETNEITRKKKRVEYVPVSEKNIICRNAGIAGQKQIPILKEMLFPNEEQKKKDFELLARERAEKPFLELERICHRLLGEIEFAFPTDMLVLFSERDLREHLQTLKKKNGGKNND